MVVRVTRPEIICADTWPMDRRIIIPILTGTAVLVPYIENGRAQQYHHDRSNNDDGADPGPRTSRCHSGFDMASALWCGLIRPMRLAKVLIEILNAHPGATLWARFPVSFRGHILSVPRILDPMFIILNAPPLPTLAFSQRVCMLSTRPLFRALCNLWS